MTELEDLFIKADLRMKLGMMPSDFADAVTMYQRYIETGGPRVVDACHMIGVSLIRMGRIDDAIDELGDLLNNQDLTAMQRGNIERDMAEAYMKAKQLDLAEISLATSLDLLSECPAEYAVSLGFLGRLQAERAEAMRELLKLRPTSPRYSNLLAIAEATLTDAATQLRVQPDRRLELYNLLNLAKVSSRLGGVVRPRLLAWRSLRLTCRHDSSGQRYGARTHQLRALGLIVGGWRLESWLARHQILVLHWASLVRHGRQVHI